MTSHDVTTTSNQRHVPTHQIVMFISHQKFKELMTPNRHATSERRPLNVNRRQLNVEKERQK